MDPNGAEATETGVPHRDEDETAEPVPKRAGLHEMFEAAARKAPGAIAVEDEGGSLTYAELDARANRLAHHLRRLGVGPEVRVGLCLPRSVSLAAALLAVLKAGGAYVPLDAAYLRTARERSATYRAERLAFVAGDAGLGVLITQDSLRSRLPASGAAVVCVDADEARWAALPETTPESGVLPDNAAYVIYTSGSTGRPKGVIGTHRAMVNRFAWMLRAYPFAEGERCAQKTSPGFVDFLWETLGPLSGGATLVVMPPGVEKDAGALVGALSAGGVSRLVVVPSLLRVLLESLESAAGTLPSLRICTTSGERLPDDLVPRFRERLPHATLLNVYGSTEVAADVTACDLSSTPTGGASPIRRPIPNVRIHVVDPGGAPCPPGATGRSTWPAPGCAAATWAARISPQSGSCPTRSRGCPGRACTAPATWDGGATTACWSTWAASITR